MREFKELKEEVRHRVDIRDVISHYGFVITKDDKTICPFHDDHTPSLSIDVKEQRWKCFVCNHGGDVFQFVMDLKHMTFPQAYNEVVRIAGMEESFLTDVRKQETYVPYPDKEKQKIKLYKGIMQYLSYQLHVDTDASLRYLKSRGITENSIDRFQLGYLDSAGKLMEFLKKKFGYTKEVLINSGFLQYHAETGVCSSMFAQRILFPIFDRYGNPIGFSGRRFLEKDTEKAKYVNSATDALFRKSASLYNLDKAGGAMRKSGMLYIVEGCFDVIAMAQAGIEQTACTLGTALSEEHIEALQKLRLQHPILMYDGDAAGQKAMLSAITLFQNRGIMPYCATLPEGMDPHELFQSNPASLQKISQAYIPDFSFRIRHWAKEQQSSCYLKNKEFVNEMLQGMQEQLDPLDRHEYLKELSEAVHIDVRALQEQQTFLTRKQQIQKEIPMQKNRRFSSEKRRM